MKLAKLSQYLLQKHILYWVLQLVGWGGLFILLVLDYYSPEEGVDTSIILDSGFTTLSCFILSHIFRKVIQQRNWLKVMFGRLLPRIILAAIILSIIALPFSLLSSYLFSPSKSHFNIASITSSIIEGAILFFFWEVAYFLYHYVNNYNRNLKLDAMINEFELNQLKSQLNPHFIFNALNSVKALVDENPEKAKDCIYQLSSILRSSLMMDKKKVIAFDEELNIVKNYLALEGTRFEERLQVHYDIQEASSTFKVPPMMLQTIVENGIKHGISKLKNGGFISIVTRIVPKVEQEDLLVIEIRNSGKYQPNPQTTTGGYGLKSTLQRLELLFDQSASFTISNEKENTVLSTLSIPLWNEQEPITMVSGFAESKI